MQEKQKKYRKFLWYALVGTLLSLFILIYGTLKDHIPDEIFVYADEETDWETFFQEPLISYDETVEVSQNGSYQIRCKWLGVLPLKTIKVHTVEKQEVLVSGSPVGIYMETKGVLVIDSGEITDREGIRRTPAEHIIQSGDYICEIDGKVLTGKRQLMQLVRENQGEPMELQVIRHQETIKLEMTPVETEDGSYKLGIWVRDNIQGIGTLTYVEPNGTFGALGHGISDTDTGERLEISDGDLYRADILSIRKGTVGTPGELRGVINYREENRIGTMQIRSVPVLFSVQPAPSFPYAWLPVLPHRQILPYRSARTDRAVRSPLLCRPDRWWFPLHLPRWRQPARKMH